MKQLFTLLFLTVVTWAFAQLPTATSLPESSQAWSPKPSASLRSAVKPLDSISFYRITPAGTFGLELRHILEYDSQKREISQLDRFYDLLADTLTYTDQLITTYPSNQVIETKGQIRQGQYEEGSRITQTFRSDETLTSRLSEVWDANSNGFVNQQLQQHYFIPGTASADSIITQNWDVTNQTWVPSRWDYQYFGNDNLRDSVYTYNWDTNTSSWKLNSKITSQYDALGQQTNLNLFQWDTGTNSFVLQLEVYEYFNGDALKDSVHLYTYFGGYYGENLSIFTYENDLVVSDTIYAWDGALNALQLVNRQTYQYDSDNDLQLQETFSFDAGQNTFQKVTSIEYHYGEPFGNTATTSPAVNILSCQFANPTPPGAWISCAADQEQAAQRARLFGLDGRLYDEQELQSHNFQLSPELKAGWYLLLLENDQGVLGRYPLVIQP